LLRIGSLPVTAGIFACRIRRHLAARPTKPNLRNDFVFTQTTRLEAGLYGSQ
jgi:hypothetical protein